MLFGLALLAGLVGYAVVDPFATVDEDGGPVDSDSDSTVDETGGLTNLLDDPNAVVDDPDTDTDTGADDPDMDDTETIIAGTDDDDLIYGGDGDYTVNGGDGDDQLHGGDGSDTLNGEAGDDQLYAGDGFADQSINTLNGGEGNDTLYGSNEAENNLNGDDGDDQIHLRGHDIATGGQGADSFHYSTEYNDGEMGTITDYNADDDQIIVEHMTDETSDEDIPPPEVTITVNGLDAVICLDGEECMIVQGAANSLVASDVLLQATPTI